MPARQKGPRPQQLGRLGERAWQLAQLVQASQAHWRRRKQQQLLLWGPVWARICLSARWSVWPRNQVVAGKEAYLVHNADYKTLLLNLVRLDSLFILQDLA